MEFAVGIKGDEAIGDKAVERFYLCLKNSGQGGKKQKIVCDRKREVGGKKLREGSRLHVTVSQGFL